MSLKTWKKEFYPISALQAHKTLDVVGLVEHSIQKWIGLRHDNLEKHDMTKVGLSDFMDSDNNEFSATASTCALCRRFLNMRRNDFTNKDCIGCPLFESRGKVRCWEYAPNEPPFDNPYSMLEWKGDPEPMIKALRKALRWAKKHTQER